MSGTVVYFGRRITAPDQDFGEVGPGSQQRACVYNAISSTLICYKLWGWFGKEVSAPTGKLFLARTTGGSGGANRTPDALLASTADITPSVIMADITGGAAQSGTITPQLLTPGYYSLGLTVQGGTFGVSMRQAATLSGAENKNFYDKASLASTTPTNPVGGTANYNGWFNFWGEAEANVAPNTPTSLSPSGNVTGGSLTPTLTANFSDLNETLNNGASYDKLTTVHIQVIRQSDNAVMWDTTYTATGSEQTARRSSKVYAGTTLAYSTAYTYKVQHADIAGAWSAWASTTFTILSAGSVALPTAPLGLVLTQTPGPITAVYTHTSGLSASNVQAQLYVANGVIVATSPVIAQTVASGGTISITFAATTWANLTWGTVYAVAVRAQDTNGVWSPYSAARIFDTDTAPNLPTSLQPTGSQTVTAVPLLTCNATDPDDSQFTSTLAVTAKIYNAAGTTLLATHAMTKGTGSAWSYQTVAGVNEQQTIAFGGTVTGGTYTLTLSGQTTAAIAWNAAASAVQSALQAISTIGANNCTVTGGPGPATYTVTFVGALGGTNVAQMTATSSLTGTSPTITITTTVSGVPNDLPTYAGYRWTATASDGTLSSAETAQQIFTYAQGPAVTVTGPGHTVTGATPTITWSVTFTGGGTQSKYRVQLLDQTTSAIVYDSGTVTSTATSHVIAAGNWQGGIVWHNGVTYNLVVTITDTNTLPGTNAAYAVTLSYTPPASLNLVVAMQGFADTHGSCYALLSWDQTTQSGWQSYTVTRQALGPDMLGNQEAPVTLALITSAAQISLTDYDLTPGVLYQWSVYQTATAGADTITSDPSTGNGQVSMDGVLLHLPASPATWHVELRYGLPGQPYAPSLAVGVQNQTITPLGALSRTAFVQPIMTRDPSYQLGIIGDDVATATQRVAALNALIAASQGQSGDGRPHLVCLRDGRGLRLYGLLDHVQIDWTGFLDRTGGRVFGLAFTFTETFFAAGQGV